MSTGIQWTDETWNPVVGCTVVSAGCDHCYAATLHNRRYIAWKRGWETAPVQYHQPFKVVQLKPERLDQPLRWKAPKKIFVNSLSDLFHEDVPDSYIDKVFAVMAAAPRHTFQILTKRPDRMRAYMDVADRPARVGDAALGLIEDWLTKEPFSVIPDSLSDVCELRTDGKPNPDHTAPSWPLLNVWLGISAENQETFGERIGNLAHTLWRTKFISFEPLLGPISFEHLTIDIPWGPAGTGRSYSMLTDFFKWVIVGGESGPNARPADVDWIRSIVRQARDTRHIKVFVKQLGKRPELREPHGGDPDEWPEDLRIREFPGAAS